MNKLSPCALSLIIFFSYNYNGQSPLVGKPSHPPTELRSRKAKKAGNVGEASSSPVPDPPTPHPGFPAESFRDGGVQAKQAGLGFRLFVDPISRKILHLSFGPSINNNSRSPSIYSTNYCLGVDLTQQINRKARP